MFHTYFLGSAEGLLFDVPDDDYDTALWAPLGRYLHRLGVEVRTGGHRSSELDLDGEPTAGVGRPGSGERLAADAVVLATDPAPPRRWSVPASRDGGTGRPPTSADRVAATRNAPPFAVWRLWLDRAVRRERPAFLGTSGFGPLDNVTVLERFEAGARAVGRRRPAVRWSSCTRTPCRSRWRSTSSGPGCGPSSAGSIRRRATAASVGARSGWSRADCPLVSTEPWHLRPGVLTPDPRLVLAGDGIRCDYPVALMERAATTGFLAANALAGRLGPGRPRPVDGADGGPARTDPVGRPAVAAPDRRPRGPDRTLARCCADPELALHGARYGSRRPWGTACTVGGRCTAVDGESIMFSLAGRPGTSARVLANAALTALLALVLGVGLAVQTGRPAAAAGSAVIDRGSAGVTADALPTAQVNGVVWDLVVAGNTVYAGGQFSTARPAGAAPGSGTVRRSNLLAFDIRTGRLTSFAPAVNGAVRTLALSPDKKTLYVGGSFTSVNGKKRLRFAAVAAGSGALKSPAPAFNNSVRAIVATASTVYAGGNFSAIGKTSPVSIGRGQRDDGQGLVVVEAGRQRRRPGTGVRARTARRSWRAAPSPRSAAKRPAG